MIRTIELFAGVGGFRIGLERANEVSHKKYEIVWSNQWEPSTRAQHASMVYERKWGSEGHSNENIEDVPTDCIPDHDLLVGGFPCQDYSVATTLRNAKGLMGKKGVLWWSIYRILDQKKKKPKYLMFENVDRLLKSPSWQRGRDFAVILKGLDDLGYAVEWRIINASDYGFPQRRRRVFFLGYHKSSLLYKEIGKEFDDWVLGGGVMAQTFPVSREVVSESSFGFEGDITAISDAFGKGGALSPFLNSGLMKGGKIYTARTTPQYEGRRWTLGELLEPDSAVPAEFFINEEDLDKWAYLKGPKKEVRKSPNGYEYSYSEGGMVFPDALDEPSRTIITAEGGVSPSRFKHVVKTRKGYRRLLPVELERLNMFPDGHTDLAADGRRAFLMGNALVVGIVERLGAILSGRI